MRRCSFVLLGLLLMLPLAACGATAAPKAYTDMPTVRAVSAKVAAHYGESTPTITGVTATLSDGSVSLPMNLVALDGHFHKGNLVATHLTFSMLADGSKVWALRATDDQPSAAHSEIWLDHSLDITR